MRADAAGGFVNLGPAMECFSQIPISGFAGLGFAPNFPDVTIRAERSREAIRLSKLYGYAHATLEIRGLNRVVNCCSESNEKERVCTDLGSIRLD